MVMSNVFFYADLPVYLQFDGIWIRCGYQGKKEAQKENANLLILSIFKCLNYL